MCDLPEPSQNDGEEPQKQAENRLTNGTFAPGYCGNPAGRPKGKTVWKAVKEQLKAREGEKTEQVAAAFIEKALGGSFQHAVAIIERQSGKVKEKGELKVIHEGAISLTDEEKKRVEELARNIANRIDPIASRS